MKSFKVATHHFVNKKFKEVNERVDIVNGKVNELSTKFDKHEESNKKEFETLNIKLDDIASNIKILVKNSARISILEKVVLKSPN